MRPLVISVTQFSIAHQQELDIVLNKCKFFCQVSICYILPWLWEKLGGFLFSNSAFVAPYVHMPPLPIISFQILYLCVSYGQGIEDIHHYNEEQKCEGEKDEFSQNIFSFVM